MEELSARNEEVTSFYHTLSHELKMPLTAGREFVSIVLDETFVGRFDVAAGIDPVQTPTGLENRSTFGFYMVFDHPF